MMQVDKVCNKIQKIEKGKPSKKLTKKLKVIAMKTVLTMEVETSSRSLR